MKFNIAKDELVSILSVVLKGTAARSTLPVLAGVLVDAHEGKVTFQTTDLEISIKHTVAANIVEPGRTVLPGKLFADIVKSFPDAAVEVSSTGEQAQISCLESQFTLSALNASDFPYFPDVDAGRTITMPAKEMADAVKKVGKAVSRDESRMILTGIQLTLEEGRARFIATDSYRLAVAYIGVEGEEGEPFSAVVPGKVFDSVCHAAVGCDGVEIGFADNQIIFKFGSTVLVSRRIEGNYPNCMQLIPSEHVVTVQMSAPELVTAVKRVSLLAQAHSPVRFSFDADAQKCTVSAHTADVGNASAAVDARVEGGSLDIAFNHQYVLDGLSSVSDELVIEMQSSLKPGIFKKAENDDFIYLAMPVRLS